MFIKKILILMVFLMLNQVSITQAAIFTNGSTTGQGTSGLAETQASGSTLTTSSRPQARPKGLGSSAGGGNSTTSTQSASQSGTEAVINYVKPTISNSFSLGLINSDKEAGLYIGNDNGQNNVVYRVIRMIAMLVGTLAILLYIVAGYFMIFSQGDENALTKGKQIATYTSLGLALVFLAFVIVQLVMGLMYFSG